MRIKDIDDYIKELVWYCNKSERIYRRYIDEEIERKVWSCLNAKISPVIKNDKPIYDSVPSFDYEDSSFPLDLLFKEQFERLFNTDLSMVKIHTGEYSNELATKQGAKAVTIGNSIFFARGMYNPYTEEGLALLAHEIEHVAQFNDKDQSFVYDEDIALAEYMAETIENQMKSIKLHSVNSGVFNNEPTIEKYNNVDYESDSSIEISKDKSLDDFTNENKEILFNITLENGKVYCLNKKERECVIEQVTEHFKSYINTELNSLSDTEKDKFILKVIKYVQHRD